MNNMLEKYDSFIFDLDGTIYRGDHLIPKADVTVNFLKSVGKKLVFVSNKTTGTVNDYHKMLMNWGLKINEDELINSTIIIKNYLVSHFPGSKFFAIAEESFINEISNAGLQYSTQPDEVEVLKNSKLQHVL
jgi:HAD superfamily hydrolase (TIGR01450 family)